MMSHLTFDLVDAGFPVTAIANNAYQISPSRTLWN